MKLFVSFFTFLFLLLNLSYALQTETLDLTQILDHQLQIKPSSDGEDSSKILLPTESSSVPDDTKSSPAIEEKEAVTQLQTIPGTPEISADDSTNSLTNFDVDSFVLVNPLPVQIDNRFNQYSSPIFRYKYNRRHGCSQLHWFMTHPRRFVGENELGFTQIFDMALKDNEEVGANRHVASNFPEVEGDDLRTVYQFRGPHLMFPHHRPRHHHHHHHHDHDDDQMATEMKDMEDDQDHEQEEKKQHKHKDHEHEHEHEEKKQHEHKHKDHEHGNSKKYLFKKIRKFLGFF